MKTAPTAGSMPVSALVAGQVARVRPDATLYDVADALVAADVSVLTVGSRDAVKGVISERDVARAVAGRCDPATTYAIDLANSDLIWCDASATVAEVGMEMMEHWVRHVLVERHGRLIGIVSARDLLGVYASADTGFD